MKQGTQEEPTGPNRKPTDPNHPESKQDSSSSSRTWKIYVSRALTAWGDRLWSFGAALFMFRIYPDSLTLMSIYGLVNSLSVFLLGAAIGTWIDTTSRLRAAGVFLAIQNVCVAVNCILLALYFYFKDDLLELFGSWLPWAAATLVISISMLANLASTGSKIVVEKDWIVVISGGDENKLAKLNTVFRAIDLTCLTVTPVLAGFLFDYTSYEVTAVCIAVWNIVSVLVEYLLLLSIYKEYPQLSKKVLQKPKDSKDGWIKTTLTDTYQGWRYYMTHKVRNAGLGLAFLYMTVLGFGGITWAYCLMQCVPESILGILVAVSAVIGIVGSISFHKLRSLIGLERSGSIGMVQLVFSLGLCVLSVWLPGSTFDPSVLVSKDYSKQDICAKEEGVDFTSVGVLLAGIMAARFGLWMADLSVTQIQQENVEKSKRGVIGGVQGSMNQILYVVMFIFVLILPSQETFGILVVLSFSSISIGAIFFISYACKQGKLSCENSKTIITKL